MRSAICPKCFSRVNEEQWVYRCRTRECKDRDKAVAVSAVQRGRGGESACPACGESYPAPLCPDCGYPLHVDESASAALSVSIAGAAGSGKSHFLAVMLEELKQRVSTVYDCSLFPLGGDDTIEQYDRKYYQPLYVRGETLESTDQNDVYPLIYSLVFQQDRNVRAINLTVYDACGANFESIAAMSDFNRNLYHSGGIIFMIDPAQLSVIAEWQAAHGIKRSGPDVSAVLARTVHLLRAGSGQKNLRQKLETPIAVCLTKLDSVAELIDPASFLMAPSRHMREAAFNVMDFQTCSLEAQSMIEAWGGGDLLRQITSQFSDCGFFGFSALGSSPSDGGSVGHVVPNRVTDPLLWLLWKNKLIK